MWEPIHWSISNVWRWTRKLTADISELADKSVIAQVAWRVATKQWLLKNGLLKIETAGKVSVHFYRNLCHNYGDRCLLELVDVSHNGRGLSFYPLILQVVTHPKQRGTNILQFLIS